MIKVNGIWRMIGVASIGFALGVIFIVSITFNKIECDGQDITIGKLKIKNSSDNTVDFNQVSEDDNSEKKWKLFKNR